MSTTTSAPTGRERSCRQCGKTYRSPRSTSLYCSASCRKRAGRGTAPSGGREAGPEAWTLIGKLLHRASYVGPISSRKGSPLVYGMTVENGFAYAEISQLFDRKGWGYVSREEFDDALKTDGILSYTARTPEGAQQKLERDRREARIKRSS